MCHVSGVYVSSSNEEETFPSIYETATDYDYYSVIIQSYFTTPSSFVWSDVRNIKS